MAQLDKSRPGTSAHTKACMVAVAQAIFARHGYSQAHTRDIARAAGVSPSLIIRHFGSKEGLFEAALVDAATLGDLLRFSRAGLGKRLVGSIASVPDRAKWPSILALSAGDPQANTIISKVVASQLIEPLSQFLGTPDARERAEIILMICTALVLGAHGLDGRRPTTAMSCWAEESIQELVDRP